MDRKRLAAERWAALSYQGRIVLVAELDGPGHEVLPINSAGKLKKALIGRPLPTGHPIHEALVGTQVRPARGISYDPDPEAPEKTAGPVEGLDLPGAPGQGLQMDPEARRAIENAAQDRLMHHYRERGWTVTDTRQSHPYDAVGSGETSESTSRPKAPRAEGPRSSSPATRSITPGDIRDSA